jgi:hypothetical protein
MKIPFWTTLLILAGLATGNYMFQFGEPTPNWSEAFKRTFFQAVGVFVYWGMLRLNWRQFERTD